MTDVGVNYLDIQEVRDLLKIRDTDDDAKLELAIPAASQSVENICGRRFWGDTVPVARTYCAPVGPKLETDDFDPNTTITLKTDDNGDGVFETTWLSTEFELGPLNPLADGPGSYHEIWPVGRFWPYYWPVSRIGSFYALSAVNSLGSAGWPGGFGSGNSWGYMMRRAVIQVTAKWGWSSVPPEVKYAAALATLDLSKGPDAPFGVAGSNDFGVLRVRENQQVMMLLAPYIKKTYAY